MSFAAAGRAPSPVTGERILGTWEAGRDSDCDIVISQATVSHRHCRFELERNGSLWVQDLGSRNGTYVDGAAVVGRVRVWPQSIVMAGPAGPIDVVGLIGQQTIGRGASCDIRLDEPGVSVVHARLVVSVAGCWVEDLGAVNGTFLNGSRIAGLNPVLAGDRIGIGTVELEVQQDWALSTIARPRLSVEARAIGALARRTRLLTNVSFMIPPGSLCGILGPSGAGKSVLLSILNGSQRPSEGEVWVGGVPLYGNEERFRRLIGFVPQDEIMHRELTVREALMLAGRLRLGSEYGIRDVQARVDEVAATLGLEETLEVIIGSPERRGISGGQRKRVNVAMELLTDPPVLLLDEPTSGLSSTDALSMFKLLESLSHQGKTVILVLHQPSDELFSRLTHVAVMTRDAAQGETSGRLAYFGAREALRSDLRLGAAGRAGTPLADAVLEAALGLPMRPAAGVPPSHIAEKTDWLQPKPRVSPSTRVTQFLALLVRWVHIRRRDPGHLFLVLAQGPAIGLLVALAFGPNQGEKLHAIPLFLLALAAIWFGCSNAAREIVGETAIFRREHLSGLSISVYAASKVVAMLPLCFIQCVALWGIVAWHCGFDNRIQGLVILLLASTVGMLLGLLVSAISRTTEAAISLVPLLLIPMVILGGLLRPIHEMPRPLRIVSTVMPTRWALEALLLSNSVERIARLPVEEGQAIRQERDALMRPADRVGRVGASIHLGAMTLSLAGAILAALHLRRLG